MFDVHSHILPGLDDGAACAAQAGEMLCTAWKQGIRGIIATPHFMPGQRNASADTIRAEVKKLRAYAEQMGYELEIYPGNEIYYHADVPELLEEGKALALADSAYVLTEFAPLDDFRYIRNALAELQTFGYTPVLAHAERYESIFKQFPERILELRGMGVLIQLNMASVAGKTGGKRKRQIKRMLKSKLADLVGTDAHDNGERGPQIEEGMRILQRYCSDTYRERLLWKNAAEKIIEGK